MLAIGVMIWLGSELMFFSGLFAALFTIRAHLASWPPVGTHLDVLQSGIFTLILISSSFTMQRAVWLIEHRRRVEARNWVIFTIILGALFVSNQAYEWTHLATRWYTNSYGSIFFERGYMTEAEHFLQLALRDDPDNSEALYGIGSIYLQQNKPSEARATFERVIKLPQRYPGTLPNAWNNLGLLSAREGRTDEAIQQFQQALQLDPDHFIALENLGNAFRQAKRWDDAKSTLQHALALNPESAEANYAMGMVYAQTNDEDRAFEYLQKAIAEKPAYPEALNNLGVLYLRKRQPTDAENSFKEAIRVAPTFEQSYFNLARLYAIEGNNAAARQILTDLLKRHPGDPQIEGALSQIPQ